MDTFAGGQIPPGAVGNVGGLTWERIRRFSGSGPANPPAISQGGMVNAASYAAGAIATGEVVAIFGSNFGASSLQVSSPVLNVIPSVLGRTRVLINDFAVPVTAVTPNQINVFVPYSAGDTAAPATVIVQVDDVLSAPVTVPLAPTAPGPFTLNKQRHGTGRDPESGRLGEDQREPSAAGLDNLRVRHRGRTGHAAA